MSASALLDPSHCGACGSSHLYLRLVGPFGELWDEGQQTMRLPKHCTECGADFLHVYRLTDIERVPSTRSGSSR